MPSSQCSQSGEVIILVQLTLGATISGEADGIPDVKQWSYPCKKGTFI